VRTIIAYSFSVFQAREKSYPHSAAQARSGTPNEYEVIANAQIIGRITLLSDRSKPWFWVISLPFRGSRRHPWHGFEATRQAAMEAFDRSWHANRRELPLPHPAQDQPE
jgi:hypothetical protein